MTVEFPPVYGSSPLRAPECRPDEALIYDPTYLHGRVAVEQILPGTLLMKAAFARSD